MLTSDKLLPVHKRFNISFSAGEGVYLYSDDKKYLDFGAGIAVNALGHCHPKMVDAIINQAKKLWHISNIYNCDELNKYAEKLTATSFADYAFFCNSGAESVECAIKMIRRHFYVKNKKNKNRIITFAGAFHGRTIATISAAGKQKYINGFEPALSGFDNVEFGNISAVKNMINDDTAGILIEPIQGEEGIIVADKKFISDLRKLAYENGLLLAFDEVQCGMGRTGFIHCYQYYGVEPDIMSLAKGIGGGFPLGACLATADAAAGMTSGMHGTTSGGNPLAMAVALSVLEVVGENDFLQSVKDRGEELKNMLKSLKNKYPSLIDDVRGVGLLLGIKINPRLENTRLVEEFMKNFLLTIPASNNVIRIVPPLIINSSHIDEAMEKIENSLKNFV
jgi:acetylornithine/N-succinyldiaminopimelate aminotransferase